MFNYILKNESFSFIIESSVNQIWHFAWQSTALRLLNLIINNHYFKIDCPKLTKTTNTYTNQPLVSSLPMNASRNTLISLLYQFLINICSIPGRILLYHLANLLQTFET